MFIIIDDKFYYRTARADNQGTALSFVSICDNKKLDAVEEELNKDKGVYMMFGTGHFI